MWPARDGVLPADVEYFATNVMIPRMQHNGELDRQLPGTFSSFFQHQLAANQKAQEQFISYDTLMAHMREDNPGCQRPGFELKHQLEVLGYRVADIPAPAPPHGYSASITKSLEAARLAAADFERADGAAGIRLFSVPVQLYTQRVKEEALQKSTQDLDIGSVSLRDLVHERCLSPGAHLHYVARNEYRSRLPGRATGEAKGVLNASGSVEGEVSTQGWAGAHY
ncbi:hypothetical protein WJX73_009575 [Symbiochloris irregularis]|uniref:Uncharacterized protein n=1 Tax=Symbiochloris irregularis TaxID=706552 RepID=A0AAW1PCJ3_9CHLO